MFVEPSLLSSSEVMLVSDNVQFFLAQSYSKCFSVVHAFVIRDCLTMISSLCHSNPWTSSFWHECVHGWFGKDWLTKVRFDFANLSAETWWAWKIDWLCHAKFSEKGVKRLSSVILCYTLKPRCSLSSWPIHFTTCQLELVSIWGDCPDHFKWEHMRS
jgi:hypothetical protein